jgi:hypothetical protein
MWNMKCFVIPVIIGATGIVSKSLQKYLETIPGQQTHNVGQPIGIRLYKKCSGKCRTRICTLYGVMDNEIRELTMGQACGKDVGDKTVLSLPVLLSRR